MLTFLTGIAIAALVVLFCVTTGDEKFQRDYDTCGIWTLSALAAFSVLGFVIWSLGYGIKSDNPFLVAVGLLAGAGGTALGILIYKEKIKNK